MNEEFIKALGDYFTASELVELLDIGTEEIIYTFQDKVIEAYEDLREIIEYGD